MAIFSASSKWHMYSFRHDRVRTHHGPCSFFHSAPFAVSCLSPDHHCRCRHSAQRPQFFSSCFFFCSFALSLSLLFPSFFIHSLKSSPLDAASFSLTLESATCGGIVILDNGINGLSCRTLSHASTSTRKCRCTKGGEGGESADGTGTDTNAFEGALSLKFGAPSTILIALSII